MNPTTDVAQPFGVEPVDPDDTAGVTALFGSIGRTAATLLASNDDWSLSGRRETQYSVDVVIDEMCRSKLHAAGFTVLSEESGVTDADGGAALDPAQPVAVVDPLDGSTNASIGLPWCATSLCLVVDGRPTVAHVANLRTGDRFEAIAGRGATRNDEPIHVGETVRLGDAIVAVNARPPPSFGPRQYRAMGAAALDIASVGAGRSGGFDGYVDFDDDMIGVWDYLAAVLVVEEAGGVTADALGRDLFVLDPDARRRPVAASSPRLLAELLDATR